MMIDNRLRLVQEKVSEYSKKLIFKQMFGLKAGVVFIDYDFRNDLLQKKWAVEDMTRQQVAQSLALQ